MYCNIIIPLEHKDREVVMVVTELTHRPTSRETFTSPCISAYVEILGGYVMDENGSDIDFQDVLAENDSEVCESALDWYNRDLVDGVIYD